MTRCRSHTPLRSRCLLLQQTREFLPALEGGPLHSFVILVFDSAPFLIPITSNARLLTILNALYKIYYLSDPSAARTIEAVSIAWIVVFAVVHGETEIA